MTERKAWDDFSANDIPAETIAELQMLGGLGEQRAWGVGRVTQYLIDASEAEGFEIPRMQMYKAVGKWCKASPESVRMWHGVFKSVPASVRQHYASAPYEPSFHQYKALVPHCKTHDEYVAKIEAWLDHVAKTGGSPEDVDALRAWLMGGEGAPAPAVGRLERLVKASRRLGDDPTVPEPVRQLCKRFLERLAQETAKLDDKSWLVVLE